MEDMSPIYEDVDIRAWAQDIRLVKTRELENLLNEFKEILKDMNEFFYPTGYKTYCADKIQYLQEKLDILKRQ
jgi:hypothetical protein